MNTEQNKLNKYGAKQIKWMNSEQINKQEQSKFMKQNIWINK